MLVRQKTLYILVLFFNVSKERKELQAVFLLMCLKFHYKIEIIESVNLNRPVSSS